MAKPRSIGNTIAPWRFLMFIAVLVIGAAPLSLLLTSGWLGCIAAFDLAAAAFLISCWPILAIDDPREIERIAQLNDANRRVLLVITAIVMAALLIALAAETVGRRPEPFTKWLIIGTLIVAWLFSNTVYALHYAHIFYLGDEKGADLAGLDFPDCNEPDYWDFIYFSFTLGMTFQTSDVEMTSRKMRRVAIGQCLAAFVFNIGVLAFTINVLGGG